MITIGIPVFNMQEFLPDAIESALNQKYNFDWEIIICNDGSIDGSYEIAKKYAEENPLKVVLIDQVNKGLASARNTILMNAVGGWLLYLDADDMLEENAIARIEQEIKNNPEADIIAPSFKCFGLNNDLIILMPDPKLEDFRDGNRVGYCCAIRKSVLLAVGGYSPRMNFGYEDLHLTMNLLTRGAKLITIPDILWLYRVKQESMITESKKHHVELLAQINKDFPSVQLNFPA